MIILIICISKSQFILINGTKAASTGDRQKLVGLCLELEITRQTLYRHVDPKGNLRPDGRKLLNDQKPAT
jgi:hypothetical protein